MASIEKSIEVNVPVNTAYNQWTQFESFPHYMEGVKQVRQLDAKRLHWRASVGGKEEEWDAVIEDQVPDQRVAWRSTTGAENAGVVSFVPLGAASTRVTLRMTYHPESLVEKAGDALGLADRRIEGDLKRFKEFIEARGAESGAWRGEIHGEKVEDKTRTSTGSTY